MPVAEFEPIRAPVPVGRSHTRDDILRLSRALERGALELHLDPVLALPQRRIAHYTALAFLRDDADALIHSDAVADIADAVGLRPAVDTLVVDRALRIARRLQARERPIGLFLGISDATVASEAFVNDIARRLDAASDLAPHIVLQFTQAGFARFGALEREMLASLAARGFRFAISQVETLDMDAAGLAASGVRHVRIASSALTGAAGDAASSIHPADLPGLFRRHGIVVVADNVTDEPTVADLLDLDLRLAQGPLFGPARPVRPEIFAGEATPAPAAPPVAAPRTGMRAIARSA